MRGFKLFIPIIGIFTSLFSISSWSITDGVPDCQDNTNNLGCLYPNVVSLSGFRVNSDNQLVSFSRCTGSVVKHTNDLLVILTAGHCVQSYLERLSDGSIVNVGVSFDAVIEKFPGSTSVWGPSQYIFGGKPLLNKEYGPGPGALFAQYDYGLIAFPLTDGVATTVGGEIVNVASIPEVVLAPLGLANTFIHNSTIFTNVGYGTGSVFDESGKAIKGSPSTSNYDTFGIRYISSNTLFIGFLGDNQNSINATQNPSRGYDGTCFGDSGGPQFYKDTYGNEFLVSVVSTGDFVCRSRVVNARVDIPVAQNFIQQCAYNVNTINEFTNCTLGCTTLTNISRCPK